VEIYLDVIVSRPEMESQQTFQSGLRWYSDIFNISVLMHSTEKALYWQQGVYYMNI